MAQNPNKFEKSSPKSEQNLRNAPPPPLPFAHHIKEQKKEKTAEDSVTVESTLKMIEEMRKKQDEIHRLLDEVYRVTGWTPKYLETYLSNPNNFSEKEWARMQKNRQNFMNSIKTPRDLKKEEEQAKKPPVTQSQAVHDPKIAKERRTKTNASRRNWLPMR